MPFEYIANGGWLDAFCAPRHGVRFVDQNTGIDAVTGSRDDEEEVVTMSDLSEKLDDASTQLDVAYDRFCKSRDRFKNEMRNDAASIAASADRIVTQFQKVNGSVARLAEMMASEQMRIAIDNAERLANALSNIERLSTSKVTFALIAPGGEK